MNKYYEKLKPFLDKGMALTTARTLLEWDTQTLAPPEANMYTSNVMGILSDEFFKTYQNDQVKKLLDRLLEEKEQKTLEEKEKAVVRELSKLFQELAPIPPEEYRAYCQLTANSVSIWAKAKEDKDFKKFAPTLKEIIDYKKKFAHYRRKGKEKLYDVLLREYEPGFTMEKLDLFFQEIKDAVIPLVKKAVEEKKPIDKSYNSKSYDIEKQKEWNHWLAGYVGFDYNKGVIADSAHPFTDNLHNHDVRITNHIYENNLESGIFSIIHESGHGIYELGISDDLTQTLLGTGFSMGMHESQSRFFENIIGKSRQFWIPIFPKLVEAFPEQLKGVDLDAFLAGINKAEPSLIRTECDELTYPLHIVIRYEIEKMIFQEDVDVKKLPELWNEKYKEYLGVEPKDDGEGILQDVHWAGGDFGYFPSYALGSAIACQIYYHMKSIMPFHQYLEEGNLTPIREYLRDHIHQYGKMRDTNTLLKDMMDEEFNPKYYIRYLQEKYGKEEGS